MLDRGEEEVIPKSLERLPATLPSIGEAVIAMDVHGRVDNMLTGSDQALVQAALRG